MPLVPNGMIVRRTHKRTRLLHAKQTIGHRIELELAVTLGQTILLEATSPLRKASAVCTANLPLTLRASAVVASDMRCQDRIVTSEMRLVRLSAGGLEAPDPRRQELVQRSA